MKYETNTTNESTFITNAKKYFCQSVDIKTDPELMKEILMLIYRSGYMRIFELNMFIKIPLKVLNFLVRELILQKLLEHRNLPERAGKAYALTHRGAKKLEVSGENITKIYKLNKYVNNVWKCPMDWRHHLLAVGAIAKFIDYVQKPCTYYFEREVRRNHADLQKIPDGLVIVNDRYGYWLEVENSPKSGKAMTLLAQTIIDAKHGSLPRLFENNYDDIVVCFDYNSRDKKGYRINHLKRVQNKLGKLVTDDLIFSILYLSVINHGVVTAEEGQITAERNELAIILDSLDKELWVYESLFANTVKTKGLYCKNWGAQITPNTDNQYSWEIGLFPSLDANIDERGSSGALIENRVYVTELDVFQSGVLINKDTVKNKRNLTIACKKMIAKVVLLLISNQIYLSPI